MYGMQDPNGFPMYWLAHCFNENCLRDHDRRDDLARRIFGFQNRYDRPPAMRVLPGIVEDRHVGPVPMPGEVVPINQLPPEHPARSYLEVDRGYSIDHLMNWGVGLCTNSPQYPLLTGRIFVPIWRQNEFVGWQGRYPADMPKERWEALGLPKYYTLPRFGKSRVLYNFDVASQYPFIVVVEGVTDVWSVGPYATAMFGKIMSTAQCDLLQVHARHKPIMIMLDGTEDVTEARIRDTVRTLQMGNRTGPVIPVRPPAGKDPGNFTPEANWRLISDTAYQACVNLAELCGPAVTVADSGVVGPAQVQT
jgi:hypothetical protein